MQSVPATTQRRRGGDGEILTSERRKKWGEAKAGVRQAVVGAAATVTDAKNRANKHYDGRLSTIATGTAHGVTQVVATVQNTTGRAVVRTCETETGSRAIGLLQGGAERLSRSPILTVPSDAITARHGIEHLAALHAADPFDARRSVWLAEALLRAERDRNMVKFGRTVINPWSAAMRGVVHALHASDDQRSPVPVVTQLLAMAYVVALAGLDEEVNPEDLHSLARVYLARGAADEAVRLAQCTVAMGGAESADAAFTLALAHRRRGADDFAAGAAEVAITEGSTLGYNVLIGLRRAVGGGPLGRELEADYRGRVRRSDVARFFGVALETRDIARKVFDRQRDRAAVQLREVRSCVKTKAGRKHNV